MNAHRLPPELVEVIVGFVLRPDWRTCRRQIAELIEENNDLVLYYLVQRQHRWSWSEEAYDEIDEWTLYGRIWLMHLKIYVLIHDELHASRGTPTTGNGIRTEMGERLSAG